MSAISFPQARGVTTDQIVLDLGKTALSIVTGTAAGFALTMFPLVGGALFCATSALTSGCIEQAILKFAPTNQQTAMKVLIKAAAILSSMCLGALALSLIGVPITVLSMVAMTAAVQLTGYALHNRSMGY
jgi:hypothetical protein